MENRNTSALHKILDQIELPDSAYIKAEQRYQDIAEWLQRKDSSCTEFMPHVFAQGSFRLGTAKKPTQGDEYDLDIASKLEEGLTKANITQKQLKELVGQELELYASARGIKKAISEKRRCWRLEYADGMSFHMDIVPCIPEEDMQRNNLKRLMVESSYGMDDGLAKDVSALAVSITDNEDPNFRVISRNWRTSNPEGFARWFESRMRTATNVINEREMAFDAKIDDFPYYRWKTPLQSAILLLKYHRDMMFNTDDKSKPISVIITTLAARAYNGESNLESALLNILETMHHYISERQPLIPNPVNPEEDFADKWSCPNHREYLLQQNFEKWLIQARADFKALSSKNNSDLVVEAADRAFDIQLDKSLINKLLGITAPIITPTRRIQADAPRPWLKHQ